MRIRPTTTIVEEDDGMAENEKPGLFQKVEQFQPTKPMLFWSCVGSVIATIVVGFAWGGWVTGGTAQEMAATAADEGRAELAAVICVEKFLAAPNSTAQLTELKGTDSSYRQRQFIEKGKWAIMPDREAATRQAASLCADRLVEWQPAETPNDNI